MNVRPQNRFLWIVLLAGLLLLVYGSSIRRMIQVWSTDPRYSHGFLVPLFSAYLLKKGLGKPEDQLQGRGAVRWGLGLVALGLTIRFLGVVIHLDWFQVASLLPLLAGIAFLIGGWPLFGLTWRPILFLGFMIPLPYRLELAISEPLVRLSTQLSTYALQTLGLPAIARGNSIAIGDSVMGIAEACSGLGMVLMFLALATALAMLWPAAWIQRLLLVASSIPIAVAANALRITISGVLLVGFGDQLAFSVYHDVAGWLMMPLALVLLWVSILGISRLFVTVDEHPRAGDADAAGAGIHG